MARYSSVVRQCRRGIIAACLATSLALAAACGEDEPAPVAPQDGQLMMMTVTSAAFGAGQSIPVENTCDGANTSPQLTWSDPPVGTKALAVVVDDPDAPGRVFSHWVVYNLPQDVRSLPPGQQQAERLDNGGIQGRNDFGHTGYDGPCPPEGPAHEYVFYVYALDDALSLEPGTGRDDVIRAMNTHVIGVGHISGTYARR